MSEVIESFIRKHATLSEKDAFDGFLQEERIRTWVGADEARKERLRKEFGRVWGALHAEGQLSPPATPRAGPAGPQAVSHGRTVPVQLPPQVEQRPVAPAGTPGAATRALPQQGAHALGGGRRLQVMCPSCMRIEVYLDEQNQIACQRCGREYHDMLQLVRVTPVGPFAFVFGEGWKGYATAAGIALGLLALYGVLRWV